MNQQDEYFDADEQSIEETCEQLLKDIEKDKHTLELLIQEDDRVRKHVKFTPGKKGNIHDMEHMQIDIEYIIDSFEHMIDHVRVYNNTIYFLLPPITSFTKNGDSVKIIFPNPSCNIDYQRKASIHIYSNIYGMGRNRLNTSITTSDQNSELGCGVNYHPGDSIMFVADVIKYNWNAKLTKL